MTLRNFIFYLLLFVAGICVAMLVSKFQDKQETEATRTTLPNLFSLGVPPAAVAEQSTRGSLVMYLHPECDYCQHELADLKKHAEELKDVAIVIISAGDREDTERLLEQNALSVDEDILLGYDDGDQFFDLFATRSMPSTFVYNQKGELLEAYQGEVSVAILLQQLRNGQ